MHGERGSEGERVSEGECVNGMKEERVKEIKNHVRKYADT